MTDLLFPLENVEAHLRGLWPDVTRVGNVISWMDRGGLSELRVDIIDQRTFDGLTVRESVTLTHTSPGLGKVDRAMAAKLNRFATVSAILPADDNAPARLLSKVGIFSTDQEAAKQVYAPLIAMQASVMSWHAACITQGVFEMDPENSPLHMTKDPTPCHQDAFDQAKAWTDHAGLLSSTGEGYYCVEFPWDRGAVSQAFADPDTRSRYLEAGELTVEELDRMAGKTSLLQVTTTLPHTLYGNGVHARLEIPVFCSDSETAALVDELNRWELCGVDLRPMFGAWSAGPRAPTFVCFIPNQFCLPGLPLTLTVWALARHRHVRQWLSGSVSQH